MEKAALDVIEIIRKLDQGMTEPYLCIAENDVQYVVKGRRALAQGLINEMVCACLGRALGLPIPDSKVLNIPVELLECDPIYELGLGYEPVFASEYQPQAEELNRTILDKLPPQFLRDLFVFDYWVRNDDRNFTANGGNPNLFYRSSAKQIVVADHNLAFSSDFDIGSFRRTHVGAKAWFDQELAEVSFNYYKEKMEAAMALFDTCCDNLPLEWTECPSVDSDWRSKVLLQLSEFREDVFWELLK